MSYVIGEGTMRCSKAWSACPIRGSSLSLSSSFASDGRCVRTTWARAQNRRTYSRYLHVLVGTCTKYLGTTYRQIIQKIADAIQVQMDGAGGTGAVISRYLSRCQQKIIAIDARSLVSRQLGSSRVGSALWVWIDSRKCRRCGACESQQTCACESLSILCQWCE
jgi:hypothetical protein